MNWKDVAFAKNSCTLLFINLKTSVMKTILTLVAVLLFAEANSQTCNAPNSLVGIKKRKAGKTEYVIFKVKKPVTATNDVTDAKPPFTMDGSGNTVHVNGCKFKQVKFNQIEWTCKVPAVTGSAYLIRDVKSTGQFEGVITYIIGYRCSAKSVVSYSYDDGDYTKYVVRLKQ